MNGDTTTARRANWRTSEASTCSSSARQSGCLESDQGCFCWAYSFARVTLFHTTRSYEELLAMDVATLRRELGIPAAEGTLSYLDVAPETLVGFGLGGLYWALVWRRGRRPAVTAAPAA